VEWLDARVKELEEPAWDDFIALTRAWLEKYPTDIFNGSSGDPGPLFTVGLHKLIKELDGHASHD